MTPATLLPPASPEAPPGPPVQRGPPLPPFPLRTPLRHPPHRDPTGRPTRTALLVSAVLHLLLGLAFVLAPERPRAGDPRSAAPATTTESVQYVDIGGWPAPGELPAAAAAGSAAPDAVSAAAADSAFRLTLPPSRFPDRVPGVRPAVPRGGPAAGAPRAGAPGAGGAGNGIANNPAGGRLGPGYGDRRLIVRPEAVPERELSELERYQRHFHGRLSQFNDSIADQAERDRRARNWIVRDRNGREWGIADGGVPVVAGRRLPSAVAPPIPRDRDQQEREREQTRQREEIDRQADAGDRDRNFRERTRAIRERRDAERRRRERERGQDTTSSNP